jgi:hypothetical protein
LFVFFIDEMMIDIFFPNTSFREANNISMEKYLSNSPWKATLLSRECFHQQMVQRKLKLHRLAINTECVHELENGVNKSHATHALAPPPFIFIDRMRPKLNAFAQNKKTWCLFVIPPAIFSILGRWRCITQRKEMGGAWEGMYVGDASLARIGDVVR